MTHTSLGGCGAGRSRGKKRFFIRTAVCCLVPLGTVSYSGAAGTKAALASELDSSMTWAEQALLAAPIKPDPSPFGFLRLRPHTKIRLENLAEGYFKYTGYRAAAKDFASAKADLDRAVRHHDPIDGPVAATFLASYAWFRADYATVTKFPNSGYPMHRFRALIREALKFDPKNEQALLMFYFLQYCEHSREWAVRVPEKPPHCAVIGVKFLFPAKWKNRIRRELLSLVKAHPDDFAAWFFLDRFMPSGLWVPSEIIRTAPHADLFYFSSSPRIVAGYVKWYKKVLRDLQKKHGISSPPTAK